MCLMILATPANAQSGKPKQPALPPVRYQVQLWSVPGATGFDVSDTNNQRQTVGAATVDLNGDGVGDSRYGFLYDPSIDLEVGLDLNDIVAGIPDGWYIRMATAINEVGQIVAHIEPIANMTGSPSLSEIQAVVIDMNQTPPSLHVIPDRAFTVYSVAGDINDFGDVTARYKKPMARQGTTFTMSTTPTPRLQSTTWAFQLVLIHVRKSTMMGSLWASLATATVTVFLRLVCLRHFPDYARLQSTRTATFCGTATVTTTKPRGTANYAFVYDTSLTVNKIANTAMDLNSSLDSVVFYYWLNHRTFGNLTIRDLLDPRDSDSSLISSLGCQTMTDRDPVTNFPVLGG